MTMIGNQMRYSWEKREQLMGVLGELPEHIIFWYRFLDIILPLRDCIYRVEGKSIGTKVVEIRTLLKRLEIELAFLTVTPPSLEADLDEYWDEFSDWVIDFVKRFL